MDDRPFRAVEQQRTAATKRRRRLVAAGVLVLLAALCLAGWWLVRPGGTASHAGRSGGGRGAPATTVGIATATTADLPVYLDALGTVTPTATVTLRPQVSGVISRILFREGQMVKQGDVLVTIDPQPFKIAQMQAEGTLRRDTALLAAARLTLRRYDTLLRQDSIAGQDVDTQAATVKQLEGTVMADQAALDTAKLNLGYTSIVAPVSGRVGLRVVDVGNYIAAGDSNGVAVVTVTDPIDVQFAVPQDRVQAIETRVRIDQAVLPVTALDRTRQSTLAQGSFLTLDNKVDTTTGTVKAKARFDNADGKLFPNQFVNARILLNTLQGAVVVPVGAVRTGANGSFVYVLNRGDNTVTMQTVTVGLMAADKVQILSGLKIGEAVVTEGADRLTSGAKVQLPKAAGGAAATSDATRRGAGKKAVAAGASAAH